MRPALPWTIALSGLLALAGAMAWATHSLMNMERTQNRMAAEAISQENARLALWRMESLAAALVVGESARPPDQYRSTPEDSPLVSPDSPVLLHFEMDPDGRVLSPQVINGPDKPPVPSETARRLQELRARLAEKAKPDQWAALGMDHRLTGQTSNGGLVCAWNALPLPAPGAMPLADSPLDQKTVNEEKSGKPDSAPKAVMASPLDKVAANYQPPQLNNALKLEEAQLAQENNNRKEADMRQRVIGDLAKTTGSQRGYSDEKLKSKEAYSSSSVALTKVEDSPARAKPVNPTKSAKPHEDTTSPNSGIPATVRSDLESIAASDLALAASSTPPPSASGAPDPASPSASAGASAAFPENSPPPAAVQPIDALRASDQPATPAAPAAPAAVTSSPEPHPVTASVSDFRALWIKDALLLTRRVSQDGNNIIQGAWIDWPQLRTRLLSAISDLFPAASLEPAPASTTGGIDLLASLPIRFLPSRLDIAAPPFWSPLKLSLATAWACVLLASIAVALVLRGMMLLSERRAAFVSAVTHELRTPLATFKLYSEMLADGLVSDPARRQSYLETLTTEADRLGHLVENVLAYSRLERSSSSDGRLTISLHDLLQRVQPRLAQRTAQAGAEFSLQHEGVPDDFSLITDPSAVEQILFNLTDNACKYARHGSAPASIELILTAARRHTLQLAVRDHGPGIPHSEARRLFRPFHKSAREAAHTAPGVGLGLALCRRLAHDLGGTLEIDPSWTGGACFVLSLPV